MQNEQKREEAASRSHVKQYYGADIEDVEDFKTSVCSNDEKLPPLVVQAMRSVHHEINSKYYGCGPVFPEAVEGCRVVDLGSGAGRDCFLLSKLVGPSGYVTGVDMTPKMLEVARKYIDYHTKQFGYDTPNVSFVEGYIEDLQACGIGKESTDIIVSNCVICLCQDKQKVFRSAYDVLKNGGELYFSDMYADRMVPAHFKNDKILWGEGVAGALYWKELMQIATSIGFSPPVLVEVLNISIDDPSIQRTIGDLRLCSATYRLFKIGVSAESASERVTQVIYKGTIPDFPDEFRLAYNVVISKCCPVLLPASVTRLLMDSRLAPHFSLTPVSGVSASESTAPACPVLSEFTRINPFSMLEAPRDC